MEAVKSEIKAPTYIDLPTVRSADGLSRFQAIALSSPYCSSYTTSFSSGEHAFINRILRLFAAI